MICQACGLDKKEPRYCEALFLVGVTRLELATPRPPVWCATTCATPRLLLFYFFEKEQAFDLLPVGRGDKIRTCDPHVPNVVLYQTEPHLDVFSPTPFDEGCFSLVLLLCFCKLLCEGHNLEAVCISLSLVGNDIIGINKCPHICNNKAQAQCQ